MHTLPFKFQFICEIKENKKYAVGSVKNMKETLSCPNAFNVKASTVNKLNDTINPINDNFKGIFFCEIKNPNNINGNNKAEAHKSNLLDTTSDSGNLGLQLQAHNP